MCEVIAHVEQSTDWVQIAISTSSILTSIIAIIISITTYKSQVRHNRNSVKPILDIVLGDYENDLYVRIDNNGVGPAIIKNISCSNGNDERNCLLELIPGEARVTTAHTDAIVPLFPLTDFVEDIASRTIAPEKNIVLLELLEPNSRQRLALRSVLKEITISINYTDIYGKEIFTTKRELSFFGRTITKIKAKVEF